MLIGAETVAVAFPSRDYRSIARPNIGRGFGSGHSPVVLADGEAERIVISSSYY
jgi:hypothetical protein